MNLRLDKDELIDSMLLERKTYQEIADNCKVGYTSIAKRARRLKALEIYPYTDMKKRVVVKKENTTTKKTNHDDINFLMDLIINLSKRTGVLSKENFKKAMSILTWLILSK
jgi:hypothetical protein